MLNEPMLRRLAFVKYMHGVAVDQSRQPEPQCAAALLTFHDSVEFFFQLGCEYLNVKTDASTRFVQYWELLGPELGESKLTQRQAMSRLNKARVALKHHGTLPSAIDLESYRETTAAFFQENCPLVFGIDYDSISLVNMVECESARALLKEAQEALGRDDRIDALDKTALAFANLLRDYEAKGADRFGDSPFRFADAHRLSPRSGLNLAGDHNTREFLRAVAGVFDEVARALPRLGEAVRVLALGIDYRRYVRFRRLTPHVDWTFGGHVLHRWAWDELPSLSECNACVDFVVDCAVRLQQFGMETSQGRGLGKKRRSLDPPRRDSLG